MRIVGPDFISAKKDNTDSQGTAGFSVLEAIIAIAILSIAFLPLLELQNQMARTTIALERNEELMQAKRSALAYVRSLNPMQNPDGDIDLGTAQMHWQATPISEERPVLGSGGQKGRFVATLYDVKVTLTFENQRTQSFSTHATGWRATASMLSRF
ncbi:MAG: hypothetical protein COA84_02925 [Robiginitomaculum sp.]|nr:MAG: hypothetical protein COA84_02925 [Robiginitomaculum sp.]